MKRLYFFLFLVLPLIFSCKTLNKDYYVIISVEESPDITFYSATPQHFETTQNIEFNCKYSLVPSDYSIDIGDVEAHSTDPDVIEILKIDSNNHTITAKTKNKGTAKITVVTQNYHSCTTLYIQVK